MIKLIAALTMLIDHIGCIFFPEVFSFRIVGRLSMPLFAYCIARGFYYSRQHGSVRKYLRNMLILALVSQLPFRLMIGSGLNIGFTWLASLLLLAVGAKKYRTPLPRFVVPVVTGAAVLLLVWGGWLPVDYGIYGIATPLLFYALIKRNKESTMNYVLVLLIGWAFYVLVQRGSLAQLASVPSAFLLTVSKKYDGKVKLPKWAFYAFYPLHLAVLIAVRSFVV